MSALAIELAERLTGEREKIMRYIAIAEHCPIPVFVIDAEVSTAVYVNPAFTQFTGFTLDDIRDDRWQQVIYEEDLPAARAAWSGLREGKSVRAARRYRTKDGNIFHGISIVERIEDNGFVGFILPRCGEPACAANYLTESGKWYPRQDSHLHSDI